MLRPVNIICLMSGMLLAGTAIAGLPEIKATNSQVGFQLTMLNVDYAETDDIGALLDTEKGPVPGSAVFFSRMWGNANAYFQAQYSRNQGRTDYVGGLIGPPATPYGSVVTTSAAIFTSYSMRLGKGFELGRSGLAASGYMLTPYIELERIAG